MDDEWMQHRVLASLNEKQRLAVTSPCSGTLQIIAGPGTGKTKVIVSRVAYLLLHELVSPENIIVTTFTKKAANEMMERLRELLAGTEVNVGRLFVGTFHSICFKIIQKYGSLVGLAGFTIADEKDSLKVLSEVLSKKVTALEWALLDSLDEKETAPFKSASDKGGYDAKKIKRKISSAKSAGSTPEELAKDANQLLRIVYLHYQALLQLYKLLDFDDCLLYCHRIISRFPVLKHIQHTLVDEFQDTNEIQLRLMYAFSRGHATDPRMQNNVTIVGDPDQSIYAFRDAQLINFEKMRQHYPKCKVIVLDQNYRSTQGILLFSEAVMRQQSGRASKQLSSNIEKSFKPVKAVLSSSDEEARWIALQIEYLAKLPGNVVSYSDIAILVRTAFQTRAIENELVRRKIPYFMVRGRAFWDRKEVSIMMDYIRCVANENDRLAYMRSINFPKRGFGPKAMSDIETMLDQHGAELLVFEILKICSKSPKSLLPPGLKTKLQSYIDMITRARVRLEEFNENPGAMETFFSQVYLESGLQKEFEGETEMDLNITEVKAQFMAFEFKEAEPLEDEHQEKSGLLFVKQFLELVSLYDVDPGKVDSSQSATKVSISTIHGAKGLEWPVVFVPGVSENLLPAAFALGDNPESVNEERRCFFVALTRAKHMLYISAYTENEGKWGRKPIEKVSRFLANLDGMFSPDMVLDSEQSLKAFYHMSSGDLASQFDVEKHYENYLKQLSVYVKREQDEDLFAGFTTAGQVKREVPRKRPALIVRPANKTPGESKTHAPSYLPQRQSAAFKPVKPVVSGNKAPVYIPSRAGNKKRLGTR